MKECPECGSKKLLRDNQGLVCGKCGLILDDKVMFSGAMIV